MDNTSRTGDRSHNTIIQTSVFCVDQTCFPKPGHVFSHIILAFENSILVQFLYFILTKWVHYINIQLEKDIYLNVRSTSIV